MTTSFPAAEDSFTNPQATDATNSPTVPHHAQHDNANDAITAIEGVLLNGTAYPLAVVQKTDVPGGDLSGSAAAPTVAKIQGTSIGAPPGGTTEFLRGDGTWQVPPGTSTAGVTSFNTRTGTVTLSKADVTGTGLAAADVSALPSTDDLSAIATANATAANVPMNSHKITGLANGSASSDAAAFGQVPVIDSTAADITTSAVGDSAAAGAVGKAADAGHKHGREAFSGTTPAAVTTSAGSAGSSASPARSDHAHQATGLMSTATYDAAAIAQQVVGTTATQTLTNKRVQPRLVTVTQSATPSTDTDNGDIFTITGLAQAITSMTTNLTGTPVDGEKIEFRITDSGTARAITWGASFASTTVFLPTTTVISTRLRVSFEWDSAASVWACIGTA